MFSEFKLIQRMMTWGAYGCMWPPYFEERPQRLWFWNILYWISFLNLSSIMTAMVLNFHFSGKTVGEQVESIIWLTVIFQLALNQVMWRVNETTMRVYTRQKYLALTVLF